MGCDLMGLQVCVRCDMSRQLLMNDRVYRNKQRPQVGAATFACLHHLRHEDPFSL